MNAQAAAAAAAVAFSFWCSSGCSGCVVRAPPVVDVVGAGLPTREPGLSAGGSVAPGGGAVDVDAQLRQGVALSGQLQATSCPFLNEPCAKLRPGGAVRGSFSLADDLALRVGFTTPWMDPTLVFAGPELSLLYGRALSDEVELVGVAGASYGHAFGGSRVSVHERPHDVAWTHGGGALVWRPVPRMQLKAGVVVHGGVSLEQQPLPLVGTAAFAGVRFDLR